MKEKYFMEDSDDNAFSLIADFEGNEEQMFDVIPSVLPRSHRGLSLRHASTRRR